MSILYITHDLGVVANIADRVYVMYAGIIAEQGSTEQIFHDAQHPYTQGLLASLPSRLKRGQRLYSIPGTVPNPAYKPAGCPFHPRCIHAISTCNKEYPKMCDYGKGHRARCPVLFAPRRKTHDRASDSPADVLDCWEKSDRQIEFNRLAWPVVPRGKGSLPPIVNHATCAAVPTRQQLARQLRAVVVALDGKHVDPHSGAWFHRALRSI